MILFVFLIHFYLISLAPSSKSHLISSLLDTSPPHLFSQKFCQTLFFDTSIKTSLPVFSSLPSRQPLPHKTVNPPPVCVSADEVSFKALYTYANQFFFEKFEKQKLADQLWPLFDPQSPSFRQYHTLLKPSHTHPSQLEMNRQNAKPTQQAFTEIISNALDANGENIGQFGRGGKQDLSLLQQEGDCLTRWTKNKNSHQVIEFRIRYTHNDYAVRIRVYDFDDPTQAHSPWKNEWKDSSCSGTIWQIEQAQDRISEKELRSSVFESFPLCLKNQILFNNTSLSTNLYTLKDGHPVEPTKKAVVKVQTGPFNNGMTSLVRVIDSAQGMSLEQLFCYYIDPYGSDKRYHGNDPQIYTNYDIHTSDTLPHQVVFCSNGMKINTVKNSVTQSDINTPQLSLFIELGSLHSLKESRDDNSLELTKETRNILTVLFLCHVLCNQSLSSQQKIAYIDLLYCSIEKAFFHNENETLQLQKLAFFLKDRIHPLIKELQTIPLSSQWQESSALLPLEKVTFIHPHLIDLDDSYLQLHELIQPTQIGHFNLPNSQKIPLYTIEFHLQKTTLSSYDLTIPSPFLLPFYKDEKGLYLPKGFEVLISTPQGKILKDAILTLLKKQQIEGTFSLQHPPSSETSDLPSPQSTDSSSSLSSHVSPQPPSSSANSQSHDFFSNFIQSQITHQSPFESTLYPLSMGEHGLYVIDYFDNGDFIVGNWQRSISQKLRVANYSTPYDTPIYSHQIRSYDALYQDTGLWINMLALSDDKKRMIYLRPHNPFIWVYFSEENVHHRCQSSLDCLEGFSRFTSSLHIDFFDPQGETIFVSTVDSFFLFQYIVPVDLFVQPNFHQHAIRVLHVPTEPHSYRSFHFYDPQLKKNFFLLPLYQPVDHFEQLKGVSYNSIAKAFFDFSNRSFNLFSIKSRTDRALKTEIMNRFPEIISKMQHPQYGNLAIFDSKTYWCGSIDELYFYPKQGFIENLGDFNICDDLIAIPHRGLILSLSHLFQSRSVPDGDEFSFSLRCYGNVALVQPDPYSDSEPLASLQYVSKQDFSQSPVSAQKLLSNLHSPPSSSPTYFYTPDPSSSSIYYYSKDNSISFILSSQLKDFCLHDTPPFLTLPLSSLSLLSHGLARGYLEKPSRSFVFPLQDILNSSFDPHHYLSFDCSKFNLSFNTSTQVLSIFPSDCHSYQELSVPISVISLSELTPQKIDTSQYSKISLSFLTGFDYRDLIKQPLPYTSFSNSSPEVVVLPFDSQPQMIQIDRIDRIASLNSPPLHTFSLPITIKKYLLSPTSRFSNIYLIDENMKRHLLDRKDNSTVDVEIIRIENLSHPRLQQTQRSLKKLIWPLMDRVPLDSSLQFAPINFLHLSLFLKNEGGVAQELVDSLMKPVSSDPDCQSAFLYALLLTFMDKNPQTLSDYTQWTQEFLKRKHLFIDLQPLVGIPFEYQVHFFKNQLSGHYDTIDPTFLQDIPPLDLIFIQSFLWRSDLLCVEFIQTLLFIQHSLLSSGLSKKNLSSLFSILHSTHFETLSVLEQLQKLIQKPSSLEKFISALNIDFSAPQFKKNIIQFLKKPCMTTLPRYFDSAVIPYLLYLLQPEQPLIEEDSFFDFSYSTTSLSLSEIRSLYQQYINQNQSLPDLLTLWNMIQTNTLPSQLQPVHNSLYDNELLSTIDSQRNEGDHISESVQNALDGGGKNVWISHYKTSFQPSESLCEVQYFVQSIRDDSDGFDNWFDILIAKRTDKQDKKDMAGYFGWGSLTYWAYCNFLEITLYRHGQAYQATFERSTKNGHPCILLIKFIQLEDHHHPEKGVLIRRFIEINEDTDDINLVYHKHIQSAQRNLKGLPQDKIHIYCGAGSDVDSIDNNLINVVSSLKPHTSYFSPHVKIACLPSKDPSSLVSIKDKYGFSVCSIPLSHPYLNFIHPDLKYLLLEHCIAFYVDYPLIRDRSKFAQEETYLPWIQTEIALAFYHYLCSYLIQEPSFFHKYPFFVYACQNHPLPFLQKNLYLFSQETHIHDYLKKLSELPFDEFISFLTLLKIKTPHSDEWTTLNKTYSLLEEPSSYSLISTPVHLSPSKNTFSHIHSFSQHFSSLLFDLHLPFDVQFADFSNMPEHSQSLGLFKFTPSVSLQNMEVDFQSIEQSLLALFTQALQAKKHKTQTLLSYLESLSFEYPFYCQSLDPQKQACLNHLKFIDPLLASNNFLSYFNHYDFIFNLLSSDQQKEAQHLKTQYLFLKNKLDSLKKHSYTLFFNLEIFTLSGETVSLLADGLAHVLADSSHLQSDSYFLHSCYIDCHGSGFHQHQILFQYILKLFITSIYSSSDSLTFSHKTLHEKTNENPNFLWEENSTAPLRLHSSPLDLNIHLTQS